MSIRTVPGVVLFGAVYIISDTHFEDPQCKEIDPQWPSPEEHIALLKKYVTDNDMIIHLGDVGNASYMDMLPSHKVLIMGNHDCRSECEGHFHEIYDGPLYIGKKILLSHEPIFTPGAVNIHGHVHHDEESRGEATKSNSSESASMNRAANVCGYLPLNLGVAIRQGLISSIKDIHRVTIDTAVGRNSST